MNARESLAHAETTIAGVRLHIHILDDGQRVIEASGFNKILAMMANGSLSRDDALALKAWHHRALAQ